MPGAAGGRSARPVRRQRSRSGPKPSAPFGVAAGDVGGGRAVIWSRADRSARMFVEYATTESFTNARRVRGPAALESSDFTCRDVADRSCRQDSGSSIACCSRICPICARWSEPAAGSFTTPAITPRDVTLAWSADTVGQGWGINPDWGGLQDVRDDAPGAAGRLHQRRRHDLRRSAAPAGSDARRREAIWKNVVTEAKSKVAQTMDDFRGCHQYNLGDEHMRRFIAEVPQIVMWDDHEVRDNWYWERRQDNDARYDEKSVAVLAARGRQAFFEYNPLPLVGDDPERIYRSIPLGPLVEVFALDMRTYKGANSPNRQATLDASSAILGPAQLQWLKNGLTNSRATWKIVAADLPLGLVVRDGDDRLRSRRQRRSWRAARSRAGGGRPATSSANQPREERRLDHGRRPLLRGAPLRSREREVHRIRSVLGVRRRPAERGDVRSEHDSTRRSGRR